MNAFTLTLSAVLFAPAQGSTELPPLTELPPFLTVDTDTLSQPSATAPTLNAPTAAQPAVPVHPAYDGANFPTVPTVPSPTMPEPRKRFASDHGFDSFVSPLTNPFLAQDPRANTMARFLFINNNFPGSHPYTGGNEQFYAFQASLAVTERLSLLLNKASYAVRNPKIGSYADGWQNLVGGFKYTLIRNEDRQFILSAGMLYEAPTGDTSVRQGFGSGVMTLFGVYGKQLGEHWHVIGNHGFSFGLDNNNNSSFFYHSWHIDREIWCWFYPFVEANWYHYVDGGTKLVRAFGEGDGLANLGTIGMDGRMLFTTAVGARFKFSNRAYAGVGYEFPLSSYKGILNNRITADLILRY